MRITHPQTTKSTIVFYPKGKETLSNFSKGFINKPAYNVKYDVIKEFMASKSNNAYAKKLATESVSVITVLKV